MKSRVEINRICGRLGSPGSRGDALVRGPLTIGLEGGLALHKRVQELESSRANKRRGLLNAQDAVDTRKDLVLSEVKPSQASTFKI